MHDQLGPDDLAAAADERRLRLIRGRRLWRDDREWLDQLDRKMTL